ncbi:MAG: acyl carrier protein [Alphaproteobacteria bacterium]
MASVEEEIYDIIAEKAAVDRSKLHRDARMEDLEIESLDVVEIIFAVEEKFDIHVPYNANDSELEFETIGDVVEAVEKLVGDKEKAG